MTGSTLPVSSRRGNPPPLSSSLVQDNIPAQVIDRVWIGSIHAAFNQESIQDRGITHVLNASGLPNTFPRLFTYFTVDLRDKENANLLSAIGAVNIFIEAGVEKGGVLVHCAAGKSRSAAFVVGFLLSTQGCPYEQAYATVKQARPIVCINRGFEQQLRAYCATQCDVFASHQMMLRINTARVLEKRQSTQRLQQQHGGREIMGGMTVSNVNASLATDNASFRSRRLSIESSPRGAKPHRLPQNQKSPQLVFQSSGTPGRGGGEAGVDVARGRGDLSFLPNEPRHARFRLCRPGAASFQVIPPLKSLERVYACQNCGACLLTGGHIIKLNIDLPDMQGVIVPSGGYISTPKSTISEPASGQRSRSGRVSGVGRASWRSPSTPMDRPALTPSLDTPSQLNAGMGVVGGGGKSRKGVGDEVCSEKTMVSALEGWNGTVIGVCGEGRVGSVGGVSPLAIPLVGLMAIPPRCQDGSGGGDRVKVRNSPSFGFDSEDDPLELGVGG
ncbi:unnamed protein product, partial [Choristocarpus tenellus]